MSRMGSLPERQTLPRARCNVEKQRIKGNILLLASAGESHNNLPANPELQHVKIHKSVRATMSYSSS